MIPQTLRLTARSLIIGIAQMGYVMKTGLMASIDKYESRNYRLAAEPENLLLVQYKQLIGKELQEWATTFLNTGCEQEEIAYYDIISLSLKLRFDMCTANDFQEIAFHLSQIREGNP